MKQADTLSNPALKKPSLRRNFSWVFIGQLIFTATNWLTTVLLAKMGGSVTVGQYSTAVAIVIPIMSMTQLMLRSVLTTDSKSDFRLGDYLTLRIISTITAILAIGCLLLTGSYTPIVAMCIIWYALTPTFDGIADIYQAYLQKHEQMTRNGVSQAARGLLNIVLLGAVYAATHDLPIAILASGISSLVILIGFDLPNSVRLAKSLEAHGELPAGLDWRSMVKPRWHPEVMKQLFILALPLGISVGLTTLNMFISRLFAVKYLSASDVGIFSGITNLMNLGSQGLMTISTTIMPRLASYREAKDLESFMSLIKKFGVISIGFGVFALAVSAAFGEKILAACFRHEFAQHNDVFVLTMVAGLLFYISLPFGTGLTALRIFNSQLWSSGMVTVFAIASGFVLVPMYGLRGAAYVTIIAMTVRCIVLAILFARNRESFVQKAPPL